MALSLQEVGMLRRALESKDALRSLVAGHSDHREQIRAVRKWLRQHLPEISEIPREERAFAIAHQHSPEYKIAEAIVEVLRRGWC